MITRDVKPEDNSTEDKSDSAATDNRSAPDKEAEGASVKEIGGRNGLDPTRYGDWEKNGRCIDF